MLIVVGMKFAEADVLRFCFVVKVVTVHARVFDFSRAEMFAGIASRVCGTPRKSAQNQRSRYASRNHPAPEVVTVGEEIEFRIMAYGFKQRATHVYTSVEDLLIEERQLEGPLRQWYHRQHLQQTPGGLTLLTDTIEFEPPGGMLGFMLTNPASSNPCRTASQPAMNSWLS